MERRNRSLKALERLNYIDSLDDDQLKASQLTSWVKEYLENSNIEDFDLEIDQLHHLSELFYKNLTFLKEHQTQIKEHLDSHHKIKEFLH